MDPIEGEREVDRWLDAALSQYGKAEPRAGLEGRVLASLQTKRSRVASKRRWWWGAGALAAMAAIAVAVWLGQGDRARTPAGASTAAIRHDDGARDRPTTHPVPRSPERRVARKAWRNPPTQRTVHTPELADVAKLERFPAPTPLSDQEKLLARYVREFPHRAALIARAQTERRKSDELEMAAPWPQNTDARDSERPE